MAFLGYGYRQLSFCNPLLRWARDASYPIYILHQTSIVAIGYYVVQTSWRRMDEVLGGADRHSGQLLSLI